MPLPKDPMMLCSVINMKLRDDNISLDELCQRENIIIEELTKTLAQAGFEYDVEGNRFW